MKKKLGFFDLLVAGLLLGVAQIAGGATFSANQGGLLGNSSVINADGSGDYLTLQAAASDFTLGAATVNGDYTFYIASDLLEPNQCAFGRNTNGHTVTIKPAPGQAPTITFSGTTQNNNAGTFNQSAGCPGQIIIGLNDLTNNSSALNNGIVPTDNFVIDGSNAVGGKTRDLIFLTPAGSSLVNSRSVHVLGSNNFVLKNCEVINYAGGPSFAVYVVTYKVPISSTAATTSVYSPTGTVIDNCHLVVDNGSSAAIYFNGLFDGQVTASPSANGFPPNAGASGYTISNNVVQGQNRTIALNYARGGEVFRNTCSGHSASSAFSGLGCSGIIHVNSIGSTGWTINVHSNTVSGLLSTNSSGEAGICLGVSTDFGAGTYNVYNNSIAGLADTQVGVNAPHNGILTRSLYSNYNILHNSINVIDVASLAATADNAAAIAVAGGAGRTTATTVLQNNLVRTAQHGGSGLDYTPTSAANLATNGNDVFTSTPANGVTPKFGLFGGVDQPNLLNWQTATGQEANGKTLDPASTAASAWLSASATNLHFSPSGVPPTGLTGVTGTGITSDIDSQARSSLTPIPGADEIAPNITYSPTSIPPNQSPVNVTATLSEPASDFDASDLTVQNGTISNFGGSGANYTFDLTPADNSGTTVTTLLGAYHDAAGRPSLPGRYPGFDETPSASTADLRFDVCSFCCNCTYPVHFCQSQFDHLNFASTHGHYLAMGTDAYRSQIIQNGNAIAAYHNDLNTSYTVKTPQAKALEVNQYVQSNLANSGPAPVWILMNEISSGLWPSNATYRTWVCDVAHELKNTYGYNVIMFAPFATPGANDADWTRLSGDAWIGVENYLSGEAILAQNFSVSWCQAQYQASITSYAARGVPKERLFLTEDFQQTLAGTSWGRAGVSAADWIHAITVRSTAARNLNFPGYITYDWSHNNMSATDEELLQFEDAYAAQALPVPVRVSGFQLE